MKRNNLIKLLEEYQPTPQEAHFKKDILNFVKNNKNCFERELEIGHITASSWIINKTGDKSLLMHHMKLDRWFQLGGHADGNSDALEVAIKEAQEESGIFAIEPVMQGIWDIDIHEIPANSRDKAHFHYDIRFLLQVKSDETVQINNESKELRWIGKNKNELPTKEISVTRMFDKWSALI
ncbi:MAG: NUDIX hydrolase [Rickettsiales bacterium]